LSNKTALAMVFKLVEGAQKTWRRLDGQDLLPKLIANVKFKDGIEARLPQAKSAVWMSATKKANQIEAAKALA
jgi:hypothetical protein